MHASYQIIIQVLQLAYTTQACILNLKAYAIQASTWICTYQIQSIKVHELALPTYVLLLSKKFWSIFFLQCCSLFVHIHVQPLLLWAFISYLSPCIISISKLSYLCTISPLLPLISIKGELLIDAKVYVWGRWLRLESFIFDGHHLIIGMTPLIDTSCNLFHLYLV